MFSLIGALPYLLQAGYAGQNGMPTIIGGRDLEEHTNKPNEEIDDMMFGGHQVRLVQDFSLNFNGVAILFSSPLVLVGNEVRWLLGTWKTFPLKPQIPPS